MRTNGSGNTNSRTKRIRQSLCVISVLNLYLQAVGQNDHAVRQIC